MIIEVVAIISDGGVAERISHMCIRRTEDLFVEMYQFRTPASGASADDVCAVMISRGNDKFLEASEQALTTSKHLFCSGTSCLRAVPKIEPVIFGFGKEVLHKDMFSPLHSTASKQILRIWIDVYILLLFKRSGNHIIPDNMLLTVVKGQKAAN